MRLLLAVFIAVIAGCAGPKIEVPASVDMCIKDSVTGKCTNETVVRHVISVELPSILTDSCRAKWNETDYPDEAVRNAGYNACVSDYINQIVQIIQGINPADLPTGAGL